MKRYFAALLATVCVAFSQVLDQDQSQADSTLSAFNSGTPSGPNSTWQTFTAGRTGTMTSIDVGFYGQLSAWVGTATIKVYSGASPTTGTLLYTTSGMIGGNANYALTFQTFATAVPVVTGNVYCFEVIGTCPSSAPNAVPGYIFPMAGKSQSALYSRGGAGVRDMSGTYSFLADLRFTLTFRTWVL